MKRSIYGISTGFTDFRGRYAVTLNFAGCNLHCPFCNAQDIADGSGLMTLNDAKNIVKSIVESVGEGCGVVFSGGEPTADIDELERGIRMFSEYPLALHTNGIVLPRKNRFETVVLSIKPPDVVGLGDAGYLMCLIDALEFYGNSQYKELRWVQDTIPEYLLTALIRVKSAFGWLPRCVENSIKSEIEL